MFLVHIQWKPMLYGQKDKNSSSEYLISNNSGLEQVNNDRISGALKKQTLINKTEKMRMWQSLIKYKNHFVTVQIDRFHDPNG